MAKSKVVIKINYDQEKQRNQATQPQMVTVWHYQRIAAFFSVLILLTLCLVYWFNFSAPEPDSPPPSVTTAGQATPATAETGVTNPTKLNATVELGKETVVNNAPDIKTAHIITIKPKAHSAVILDRSVVRASLNIAVADKDIDTEPFHGLIQPIVLDKQQNIELFYFNQLKYNKEIVLFHYWSKQGKLAYKKQFDLKHHTTRLISAKKFNKKDAGEWQVQLVDAKGKVFSTLGFLIAAE